MGLALAVLPLVISAVEHYKKCLRPIKHYRTFARDAERVLDLLSLQRAIFNNQCRILLERTVDHDVAANMLKGGARHPQWSDKALEEHLCQMLGDSREEYAMVFGRIEEQLECLDKRCQDLESTINQDPRVFYVRLIASSLCFAHTSPHKVLMMNIGSKAWKKSIAQRIRFSFSKPRLDNNLIELKSWNEAFLTLSNQTLMIRASKSQNSVGKASQKSYQEMEKYKVIGQASQQVYEALGAACTNHTEHLAHFCVEAERATPTEYHGTSVKFTIAFSQPHSAGPPNRRDLVWFVIDSITDDASKAEKLYITSNQQRSVEDSRKRTAETATCGNKKIKRSVRFHLPTSLPSPQHAAISCSSLFDDDMGEDFCDILRKRLYNNPQMSECIYVLKHHGNCQSYVYPSHVIPQYSHRQAISLEQLIAPAMGGRTGCRISLYERLRLARMLSVAVLQYHSTPWLNKSWRSEDIYLIANGLPAAEGIQSFVAPHLNVKVQGSCSQPSHAPTCPSTHLIRNPLLFGLGVVLLEIAYTANLASLRSPLDLEDGLEDRYMEFRAARRLAKLAKTDMGGKYHKVVEKLVECDFGCGRDLNDPSLQIAYHNAVICPLEKLEKDLEALKF